MGYTPIKIAIDDYDQEICNARNEFKCNYYVVLGRFSFVLLSLSCTALHLYFILYDV